MSHWRGSHNAVRLDRAYTSPPVAVLASSLSVLQFTGEAPADPAVADVI